MSSARIIIAAIVLGGTVAWSGVSLAGAADWRLTVEAASERMAPRAVWLRADTETVPYPDGVRFIWLCGEGLSSVETARAAHGCWYEREGRYRPAVTVLAPGAAPRILAAPGALVVEPRPAAAARVVVEPRRQSWQAPAELRAMVRVTGLPVDEPVTQISWVLDDAPTGEGESVRVRLVKPGAHRLMAVVRTAYRRLVATTDVPVAANQPPTCTIEQTAAEPPAPPRTVRLSARCSDDTADEPTLAWSVNGQTLTGSLVEWTAPAAGRYPVRLVARDRAGAETSVETVIEWGS